MTKMVEIKCRKCGDNLKQAAERGAFLNRVSPKGQPFIGECSPCCTHWTGDPNDAVISAVKGQQ